MTAYRSKRRESVPAHADEQTAGRPGRRPAGGLRPGVHHRGGQGQEIAGRPSRLPRNAPATMGTGMDIRRIGIWSSGLRDEDPGAAEEVREAAAELEELGYGAIWLGSSPGVRHAAPLLD